MSDVNEVFLVFVREEETSSRLMSCTDKNMHVRINSVLSSAMKLDQLQFGSFCFFIKQKGKGRERKRQKAHCHIKSTEEKVHQAPKIVLQSSQLTGDRHSDRLLCSPGILSVSFPISFTNTERSVFRPSSLNSVYRVDKLIPVSPRRSNGVHCKQTETHDNQS